MNDPHPTRRRFLGTSLAAAAAATSPFAAAAEKAEAAAAAAAAAPADTRAEDLVRQLYASLNAAQRDKVCFGWDHQLRQEIDNNWHITKTNLRKDFDADQGDLVRQIFMALHSEEYAESVYDQVEEDGGFDKGSIAIFGDPASEDAETPFQFVYTGRHCTRRCDGSSTPDAAFGGPIFYGHAAGGFNEGPDHEGNAYWFQAERANSAFQMLDGAQREKALINTNRREQGKRTIELTGKFFDLPGIALSELTRDQKAEVGLVLDDLLAPFRERDRTEARRLIEQNGLDNLHMSFSKKRDIGNDGVWDVWEIQGPSMIWYFRGDPHVHTWVHVRGEAEETA